jgi:hypothetical protein
MAFPGQKKDCSGLNLKLKHQKNILTDSSCRDINCRGVAEKPYE